MALEEHLKIINQGVAAWNRYRQENPDVVPDLSGARIRRKNLGGINLRGADLSGASLPGARLKGANLEGADLSSADLMQADLRNAWLAGAVLRRANLFGANLKKADLTGADLTGAIIYREDLAESGCADSHIWFATLMNFGFSLCELEGKAGKSS